MKLPVKLFLVALLLLLNSCSDSVSDLETDHISIQVESEDLQIKNNFNHSVYYFAVESGVAALINWAPISSEENRVKPKSVRPVSLDEIHGYKPGKTILFYYWSEKEPSSENIKFRRLETK